MNNNSSNAPVIVIGFPRSGTTLLLHILLASDQFAEYNFSESHFFSHYFRRYGSLKKARNRKKFISEISKSEWFQNSSISMDEIIARTKPHEQRYDIYFKSFMDLLAEQANKSRWVEKTPWHMLYIHEIHEALPDAKFIFVIRDPRDSIQSVLAYGWSGGIFSEIIKVAVAWNWHINHTRNTLEKLNIPYLVVRYEDLTANIDTVLKKLNAPLNLNLSIDQLQSGRLGVLKQSNSSFQGEDKNSSTITNGNPGISSVSRERWRKTMTAESICNVEYITHQNLQRYDYEITSSQRPKLFSYIKIKALTLIYNFHKIIRHLLFPLVRR